MTRCPSCRAPLTGSAWICAACRWSAPSDRGIPLLAPELAHANDGYGAGQHAVVFETQSGHFWYDARNALIVWALDRHFPAARSFFELGSGTGYVGAAIARANPRIQITAAELYLDGAVLTASTMPGATVVQADGRQLPYEDEFDAVGAFDVIEHVDDDWRVLEQLHACVRPGGGLLLTVPQHPWLWGPDDELGHHKRRYTRADLIANVRAAGFSVLRCTSFVTLLLPVLIASRFGQNGRRYDPMRPFRLKPSTNATCRSVMTLERALIRSGLTLPAGGSLLLVARKPAR